MGLAGVASVAAASSLLRKKRKDNDDDSISDSELNQAPVYDFTQYVDSKRKNDDLEQAAIDWINSKERKEWQERQKNNTKGKTR